MYSSLGFLLHCIIFLTVRNIYLFIDITHLPFTQTDDPEKHELKSRHWLFFSPFFFPPKKRGKKKRRMNSKNRDFKSCLSGSSKMSWSHHNLN